MKHIFWMLAIAGLYISCKDPDPAPPTLPDDYWGEASAQKNGQLWTANPACYISIIDGKTINLQLDSFFAEYYLKEALHFSGIPFDTGTYEVARLDITQDENVEASHGYFDDDVSIGAYQILETDGSNFLVLESYDILSKEIKRKFDLTFIVSKRPYPGAPDTIRFREGKFHGKLHKK
jgi:hypothetical protein